jgi:hypothetical protein
VQGREFGIRLVIIGVQDQRLVLDVEMKTLPKFVLFLALGAFTRIYSPRASPSPPGDLQWVLRDASHFGFLLVVSGSVDEAEHFAADTPVARLLSVKTHLRGRNHGDTQPLWRAWGSRSCLGTRDDRAARHGNRCSKRALSGPVFQGQADDLGFPFFSTTL